MLFAWLNKEQSFNTSIHFLLGVDATAESSNAPCTAEEFIGAFHTSLFGTGIRSILGPFRFLVKFKAARQRAHEYLDFYIKQVLEERSVSLPSTPSTKP